MKRLFFILIASMMELVFTSCEQTEVIDESPVKGTWEYGAANVSMTLIFGEKDVEYACFLEHYGSQATYFGAYAIKDKTIILSFDSIKTNKVNHPKIEYTAPEEMPTEAVLCGDSAIIYLDYTFRRKY